MDSPAYRDLADRLRAAIEAGDYPQGAVLPRIEDLAAEHGVALGTARQAIAVLEAEGLVEAVRRRGTVVRHRPDRQRLTRSRQVYRDERGYYFDPGAKPWTALTTPTIAWARPPRDVAHQLGTDPADDVLVRDRLMGDPTTGTPLQIATSYLPATLARGTRLEEADTGQGGIYDLLETMGHGPLQWTEAVCARMPTPDESARLRLAKGVPLLRIIRTTSSPGGTVLEVNDTRMSSEVFEVGYPITRHRTAQTPE